MKALEWCKNVMDILVLTNVLTCKLQYVNFDNSTCGIGFIIYFNKTTAGPQLKKSQTGQFKEKADPGFTFAAITNV